MKNAVLVLSATLTAGCCLVVPVALGQGSAQPAPAGPKVVVEVKSQSKTLLKPTKTRGEKGSITKGGTPKGKCPGTTAAGALDAATHGRWTGKYYASVQGIFVTSILGVKPSGKGYWGFFVNGKASSAGICGAKLAKGQHLLFKIVK
jgi:Domain of unknown function (DUF4430)